MSVNDQKFELDNGTFYVDYRPSNEKPYYVMSLGRKDNLVYEGEFKTEREAYDHIQLCVKCKVANRWEKYTCCMECIIG